MLCREAGIYYLNNILDEIHNESSQEQISRECEEFKRKFDYEELKICKHEVRNDRLKEYIKFFNISYVCEYDIFESKEIFYETLKEHLEKELWEDIEKFLKAGNILCDYSI